MNELQLFKNEKLNLSVRAIYNDDGSISVSAEDCARGLGFVDKSKSATSGAQLEKVRWARINKYLNEFGISQQVAKGDFIPESVFYLLAMKANNATAKDFQIWVANDVIPQIRKTGSYSVNGSKPADNPTERLAQIISNCTMVEQIDLIRDLYAIPHTPQNSPVEPQKAKPVQNNQETVKVLKNKDFRYSEDRYKTIDAFLKTYKVESGELTKEVYQRYVAFCNGRGVIPRTRQAFVSRMKTVTRLDIIQGRYGSVITNRS